MKPTILITFLLWVCGNAIAVEQRMITGKVIDENHNPIPFCVVRVLTTDHAAYCNELGGFTITANKKDQLLFHCVGYEDKLITANTDSIIVMLNVRVENMNEVAITAHKASKHKYKLGVLGKKHLKPYSIFTGEIGSETAIYLKADTSKKGYIKEVCFYILKEGIPDSRFRVHVYDIDTNYLPGKDLTDSNIIVHGNAGNEWVKVDLSAKSIPVGRGVFVSMEWIEGYNNSKKYYRSSKYYNEPPFQGQVLAST